jgi:hypothetical protein
MEFANPILGNPILLIAIVLFLAVLPRALRQRKKTTLDKTVERFEKEELLAATVEELNKDNPQQENLDSPKDRSLGYPTTKITQGEGDGGIPPFPEQTEEVPVKIIKEGIPISHNEAEALSSTSKKKVKLIKQETSIASEIHKDSENKPSVSDSTLSEESEGNWVEAEIPGLIMEPLLQNEEIKDIPTFKAAPKAEYQSEPENSPNPPQKDKSAIKVKNLSSQSEEKEDSKLKKQASTKKDSSEIKLEISKSKPIVLEIKAPIVSHKNIAKKGAGRKKGNARSAKVEKNQETEPTVAEVLSQQEDMTSSSEKVKAKPFLLDLKYMIREELETADSVSHEKFHSNMVDAVIDRLNSLQTNLENQLVARHNPVNGNMRKNRVQDSLPSSEEATHDPSDKKEVSLNELDSFLFTATQRKSRE